MSEKESKEKSEVYQAWADSINKVWKAGLGALSEAEKRGDQLVQTLVEKGKHYEDLVPAAEDAVKDSLSAAKEQATRGVRNIEAAIDRQIDRAIERAGLAKQEEIDALKKEVARLKRSRTVKTAGKRTTTRKKSATKARAAKTKK